MSAMSPKTRSLPLLISLGLGLSAAAAALPHGWLLAGGKPSQYRASLDTETTLSGHGAGVLQHVRGDAKDFGTLMTTINPADYAGKRVRLKGWLRLHGVVGWAGLWMRADSPDRFGGAFYNSQDLQLHGSQDWMAYSVVLDIPADADRLSYGVLLDGRGTVWLDRMTLEVVEHTVPLSVQAKEPLPRQPVLFQ